MFSFIFWIFFKTHVIICVSNLRKSNVKLPFCTNDNNDNN